MMKSIIHLPDDLFSLFLSEKGISHENIFCTNFSDISRVSFLSVKLPPILLRPENYSHPYQNWPQYSRNYPNYSILDYQKKAKREESLFTFLMFATKDNTTLCSLHVSESPKLRGDCRPPIVAMVNAGKRVGKGFVRPFIEYREYVVHPLLRQTIASFYSGYQTLMQSGNYYQDLIDSESEDVFSDIGKPKEKNPILRTLSR